MGNAGEDKASRIIDVQPIGRDVQTADVVRLVIIERIRRVGAIQPVKVNVEPAQIFDINSLFALRHPQCQRFAILRPEMARARNRAAPPASRTFRAFSA
jgi:hypothetical protein